MMPAVDGRDISGLSQACKTTLAASWHECRHRPDLRHLVPALGRGAIHRALPAHPRPRGAAGGTRPNPGGARLLSRQGAVYEVRPRLLSRREREPPRLTQWCASTSRARRLAKTGTKVFTVA